MNYLCKPLNNNQKCIEIGNYLKYLDNPHARYVVDLTAQLWLHIPISFVTAKAEELRHLTIGSLHYASRATRNSIKEQGYLRPKGLICGKKRTEKL